MLRVLITTPRPSLRSAYLATLEDSGFVVETVSNELDSLDMLSMFHPDVVVVDLEILGNRSHRFLKRVAEEHLISSRSVVLFGTGIQSNGSWLHSQIVHSRHPKPLSPTALLSLVCDIQSEREEQERWAPWSLLN